MTKLGDRMKAYEKAQMPYRLDIANGPIMARLDGRSFSKFTQGLDRPYDARLTQIMISLTEHLVRESNASMGYTQSDEITLTWWVDNPVARQIFFDGKVQKMVSILAGMATGYFSKLMPDYLPEKAGQLVMFDCRVWQVPSKVEATNAFLWRELDASKNSISMLARMHYSHKALQGKNGKQMIKMIAEAGDNYYGYHDCFRRGTFVQRRKVTRPFSTDEIENLPAKHEARTNPDLMVERTEIRDLYGMPPFRDLINPVQLIFHGDDPVTSVWGDEPTSYKSRDKRKGK